MKKKKYATRTRVASRSFSFFFNNERSAAFFGTLVTPRAHEPPRAMSWSSTTEALFASSSPAAAAEDDVDAWNDDALMDAYKTAVESYKASHGLSSSATASRLSPSVAGGSRSGSGKSKGGGAAATPTRSPRAASHVAG